MSIIFLNLDQFASKRRRMAAGFVAAAKVGLLSAALRSLPFLRNRTRRAPSASPNQPTPPPGGAVNTGQFLRSWTATTIPDGARIQNVAPYASIVEHGSRAGGRLPPLAPLLHWVQRRLGLDGDELERAANAIRWSIKHRGLLPRLILTAPEARSTIQKFAAEEVAKAVARLCGGK